jgi:hypothetical protein
LRCNTNARNRARLETTTGNASAFPQEFHGRSKQRERQTVRRRRKNIAVRSMGFEDKRLGHGRAFQTRRFKSR